MTEIYDLVIIGAGPAGVSAAIYASRAMLKTVWVDNRCMPGGQITDTYEVDNYPGMPGVTGMDLGEAFGTHAEKLGLSPACDEVLSIEDDGKEKIIRTRKNAYRTKAVILALGASHRKLGIPGEEKFGGAGVSYCATCDGAFFRGRTTVVVGGGNVACEDAIFLSRMCEKVYLVHRRDALRADKILQERLFACENVELVWNSDPVEIQGEDMVKALLVKNKVSGEERRIEADGVFIAVGTIPNTWLVKDMVETDDYGYIVAGEEGITSVPGIFAAGDLRTKSLRQVVTAVSDGANAVTAVQEYLLRI